MRSMTDFLVKRDEFRECRVAEGDPAEPRARAGAAAGRDLRHDLEQRHLRRLRRGDVLLGLLPDRRGGLGTAADLGLRRGREQRGRGGRGGDAPLRLPARLLAPGRHPGRRRRVRLRRRLAAQSGAALGLPPLSRQRRRQLLPARDRGGPDAAAAALLHLVPDRRPARRRGPGDARAGDRLERLEQDRDRRRLPARPARGRRARRADRRLATPSSSKASASTTARSPTTRSTRSSAGRRPTSTSPATATCAGRSTPTSATTSPTAWRSARPTGRRWAPAPATSRARAGLLLRPDQGPQARRGLGPRRAREACRRRLAPVLRVDGRLARDDPGRGLRRGAGRLARRARGAGRARSGPTSSRS